MASNSVYQIYPANQSSVQFQYSNVQISISSAPGVYFPFIMSVSYQDSLEVAEGRGTSPYAMGTTLGQLTASGSIEVQKAYSQQFLDIIAAGSPDGNSLYDNIFQLNVQYSIRVPVGQTPIPVVQDVLVGCRLKGSSQDLSAGSAVISTKWDMYVAYVIWAGRLPIAGLPQ